MQRMEPDLTPNALLLLNSENVDGAQLQPVVQVLDMTAVGSTTTSPQRYRLVLSDGIHTNSVILATHLNMLATSGALHKSTIIQLLNYHFITVQEKRIILVTKIKVMKPASDVIGGQELDFSLNDSDEEEQQVSLSDASTSPPRSFSSSSVASSYKLFSIYSDAETITEDRAAPMIVPIKDILPFQVQWTIKSRVIAKHDTRMYKNAKGNGKVFQFDLVDVDGGEIRVTCFNKVVDQFYNYIELGKVYLVSGGLLKPAEKEFNSLNNTWEIILLSSSTVTLFMEKDDSIPIQRFEFKPIGDVANMDINAIIDVIGVVIAISPIKTITQKNGNKIQMRKTQMMDFSHCSVELTMWGSCCAKEGQHLHDLCMSGHFPILAVKEARVVHFNGKSIGTISTTQLLVNPDFAKAYELRRWFELEGRSTTYKCISTRTEIRKTLAEIVSKPLGQAEKPEYVQVRATIIYVKTDTFCYAACPLLVGDRQCSKKVTGHGDGQWWCNRCNRSVPECEYKFILKLRVQDHTGNSWLTAFEAAEQIVGVTAKELYEWRVCGSIKFCKTIQKLHFGQHVFKLKVQEVNHNNENSINCTILESKKIEYDAESRHLLDSLKNHCRWELTSIPLARVSNNVQKEHYKIPSDRLDGCNFKQGEHFEKQGTHFKEWNSETPASSRSSYAAEGSTFSGSGEFGRSNSGHGCTIDHEAIVSFDFPFGADQNSPHTGNGYDDIRKSNRFTGGNSLRNNTSIIYRGKYCGDETSTFVRRRQGGAGEGISSGSGNNLYYDTTVNFRDGFSTCKSLQVDTGGETTLRKQWFSNLLVGSHRKDANLPSNIGITCQNGVRKTDFKLGGSESFASSKGRHEQWLFLVKMMLLVFLVLAVVSQYKKWLFYKV